MNEKQCYDCREMTTEWKLALRNAGYMGDTVETEIHADSELCRTLRQEAWERQRRKKPQTSEADQVLALIERLATDITGKRNMASGTLTIPKRYPSWPWKLSHSWLGEAEGPTLLAALQALDAQVEAQPGNGAP